MIYCLLFLNYRKSAKKTKHWQEMKDMIHEYGGKNYSIFFDKETNILFGYIEIDDPEKWA
jgi:L-rhamnose mutarotase